MCRGSGGTENHVTATAIDHRFKPHLVAERGVGASPGKLHTGVRVGERRRPRKPDERQALPFLHARGERAVLSVPARCPGKLHQPCVSRDLCVVVDVACHHDVPLGWGGRRRCDGDSSGGQKRVDGRPQARDFGCVVRGQRGEGKGDPGGVEPQLVVCELLLVEPRSERGKLHTPNGIRATARDSMRAGWCTKLGPSYRGGG